MTIPWQPGSQGVTVIPPGYTDPHTYSSPYPLQQQAATALAGFTLQNATPTILTWVAPADNRPHLVLASLFLNVSSAETGGALTVDFTDPGGTAFTGWGMIAAAQTGSASALQGFHVSPGSVFSLIQSSALTAGTAVLFASLWAS